MTSMTSRTEYNTQTQKTSTLFSGQYLRNHWTLDIGVMGYIGIVWPKEHSPEVRSFPPGTSCILVLLWKQTKLWRHICDVKFLGYWKNFALLDCACIYSETSIRNSCMHYFRTIIACFFHSWKIICIKMCNHFGTIAHGGVLLLYQSFVILGPVPQYLKNYCLWERVAKVMWCFWNVE